MEIIAPTTPVETIQLHNTPRRNNVSHAGRSVGRVAESSGFTDVSNDGADLIRRLCEAVRCHECHQKGCRKSAGKVADKDQTPISQNSCDRDAWPIVEPGQRTEYEHTRQQIKAQEDQHGKSDGEQKRANHRLAGVHVDRDREPGRQCQNRAGHVGAHDRVSCRHEDLGLTGVNHLGDEFRRNEIRHGGALLLVGCSFSTAFEQ